LGRFFHGEYDPEIGCHHACKRANLLVLQLAIAARELINLPADL
jgi:hypothetical protein